MAHLGNVRTGEAPGRVIYTALTHTTGGREKGIARSSDGRLGVKLSLPGSPRIGTNPEQLFAAGWSACFESAIGLAARKRRIALTEVIINAEFDLHLAERDNHFLSARLNVGLPGVDRNMAEQLIEDAEQLCPYSKATRGNIELSSTSFEPDPLCLLK
jgi:Ohr subfamily peroxiredoxin